jgi:hypothetical protein
VQRQTRFTLEQIGDMDDDQLLFWYSGGKSTATKQANRTALSVKLDPKKTWAENLAEIQRRKQEWEAANSGKNC